MDKRYDVNKRCYFVSPTDFVQKPLNPVQKPTWTNLQQIRHISTIFERKKQLISNIAILLMSDCATH